METQSTHFIFDGEKVVISPDLLPVLKFLQEIEKEVESFLGIEGKLVSIRKQYEEVINLVAVLAQKIKENSIGFDFTFSENPSNILERLKFHRPLRSEMIILFANLETLFCLITAYKNKTSDEKEIRRLTMDEYAIKSFLKDFCLNGYNEWGQKYPQRLKRITIDDTRKLRNSLTHFFSVGKGLGISCPALDDKARKLEELIEFKSNFISPEDLYGIIKGAAMLIIKKWNEDCRESITKGSNDFKERILCVKDTIADRGAVVVNNNQINI